MSTAEASGAAHDATVDVVESPSEQLTRKLAELDAQMSDEERERLAKRADLAREHYELQSKVPGTREYDAHRAQLERLVDDAERAIDAAAAAEERAEQALEGAHSAVGDARDAHWAAAQALEAFDRDHGSAE